MTDIKPWHASRTVWAALVTVAAAGLGLAGIPLGEADQSQLVDALLQGIGAIAGLVALYGRLRANSRIG